jgi:hypothetical protein
MARETAAGTMTGRLVAFAALALLLPAAAPALESAAKLAHELHATGRAEVTLRYSLPAAPGAAPRVVFGSLALEPPDRVRLDVPGTGERIVANESGGAWLQPATKQLLRFGPRQVSPALRWWRVLLGDAPAVRERRVAPGQFVLVLPGAPGAADSATVWLDARGLPSRLEVGAGESSLTYRLSGWHFARARGPRGFVLVAPAGFETVEVP